MRNAVVSTTALRRGVEQAIVWHFDLCPACARRLEQSTPWIRGYLEERYDLGAEHDHGDEVG
jgi:hypothetical protein